MKSFDPEAPLRGAVERMKERIRRQRASETEALDDRPRPPPLPMLCDTCGHEIPEGPARNMAMLTWRWDGVGGFRLEHHLMTSPLKRERRSGCYVELDQRADQHLSEFLAPAGFDFFVDLLATTKCTEADWVAMLKRLKPYAPWGGR